jgi:hypothetical protein
LQKRALSHPPRTNADQRPDLRIRTLRRPPSLVDLVDTEEVTGSIPVSPTTNTRRSAPRSPSRSKPSTSLSVSDHAIPQGPDESEEFTGGELTRVCARAGITQAMGRTGSALDNAVSESFHSTLEFELLSRNRFANHAEARQAVMTWLEEYNTVRFHSTNGMLTPVEFEHGRRRPGAKSYDQLRRRHYYPNTKKIHDEKTEAEAAAPPDALIEPLRDPHRRRAVPGPAPPASRAATAVATATALRAALDPGASTGPGRQHQGQATACPATRAKSATKDP